MQETELEDYYLSIYVSYRDESIGQQIVSQIEDTLAHEVVMLEDTANPGPTNIKILEEATDECAFAVIVLTTGDAGSTESQISREKTIHEIGFCQGTFGRENVLVLKQDGVRELTSLAGVIYIPFKGDDIKSTFSRVQTEIETAIDRFEDDETDEE